MAKPSILSQSVDFTVFITVVEVSEDWYASTATLNFSVRVDPWHQNECSAMIRTPRQDVERNE
jgi:hypothetical protein